MVAVMMPSNFLSHVSLPVNATLPSPLQFSTWKPLKDDALILSRWGSNCLVHQFIGSLTEGAWICLSKPIGFDN